MHKLYTIFLKKLLIFSLSVTAIEFILSLLMNVNWVSPYWWLSIVFFIAIDIISYKLVWKQMQKNSRRFISAFLMSATARVFLSLIIIVSHSMYHPKDAKAFIAVFFINYLLFTVFETIEIMRLSKTQNEKTA